MRLIFVTLILSGIMISGCSNSSSSTASSNSLNFSAGAVEALPQTSSGGGSLVFGTSAIVAKSSSGVNISTYSKLASFFEQECFMPDGDNYCPAGVDTSGGDSNPRKFTSYTLLGMIYHAEMYSGSQRTSCDQGAAATIDATSYKALTSGGSEDPDKFILDYNTLLQCLYEDPSSDDTSKQYMAYSFDASGAYQATLTTRNRVPYSGVTDPGQNDVFQVYVTNTDGTPSFLGFNYAGADTVFSRTILLVNLTNNKFAVKHSSYNGSGYDTVVAIGVGGVDRTTGTPNAGYYMVKFTDSGSELEKCVNNADGMIEVDMSSCNSASIPTTAGTTTWTSATVQTYLGMSATEITNMSDWFTKMADTTALGAADTPTNASLGGDPDINFPRTIEAAP